MARLIELTWENGLIASEPAAYKYIRRICPPLCFQMQEVELFEGAINISVNSL